MWSIQTKNTGNDCRITGANFECPVIYIFNKPIQLYIEVSKC